MKSAAGDLIVILFIAGVILFFNLGRPKLWDRDEPRNAGCAREMMERGDWIVPVFNAELRTHKPVLLYWLMMVSYAVFGVTEFAARFWSASLSLATVMLTYAIGCRLLDRLAGFWSACILTTFVMYGVVGRAATPDATLIFLCTAALTVYVYAVWPKPLDEQFTLPGAVASLDANEVFPRRWWEAVLVYGLMGMAVLAKGPVGLVLPTAVIGMFCLIERARTVGQSGRTKSGLIGVLKTFLEWFALPNFFKTCWAMRPLTAIAVVLAIAGPWYAWVGLRTDGAWLAGFLGEHNVGRALQSMEGHSGSTLLYYPIALLACCFPWSVFTVPAVLTTVSGIRNDRRRQSLVFLSCWLVVYIVIFSIARTKLPSYIAPAFPAAALLMGAFVSHLIRNGRRIDLRWPRRGMVTLAWVGIVMAIGLNLALRRWLPRESSLSLVALVPIGAGVMGMVWLERRHVERAMKSLTLAATAFSVLLFGVLADRVSQYQQYDQLLSRLDSFGTEAAVGSFGRLEPTWVFYAKRPIQFFNDERIDQAAEFVTQPGRYLVVTEDRLAGLNNAVPAPLRVIARSPYFLKDQQLLVVTSKSAVAAK